MWKGAAGCLETDCTPRCKSQQHGAVITRVVSVRDSGDSELASYLRWLCAGCGVVTDPLGRTALHLAASCGRQALVQWLIRHRDANINARDPESGYTALHRSILYGQIHVTARLMQLGASLNTLDHEHLTPIDHAMKDRLPFMDLNPCSPCEVYMWGTNSNYTLGIGHQQQRTLPELLDTFRKQNISIKQVAMHKFHTVFVAHNGNVYSCGHGQGGRLGLGCEQAALTPCAMKLDAPAEVCVEASVGRDHTVLLMESGAVLTCGLNTHRQLGHMPPPPFLASPRALPRRWPKGGVSGVCAARFHTVVWGRKLLLTCGLNAGQLGHQPADRFMMAPKKVVHSYLSYNDCDITHVAVSDGAIVIVTSEGDIFILHEYQCRKIAKKQVNVKKVVVVGGHLDPSRDTATLVDRGGEELKVAVLMTNGSLFLWQESSQQLMRCTFSLRRVLILTDVSINCNSILFVTNDGEAFQGEVKSKRNKKTSVLQDSVGRLSKSPPTGGLTFHEKLEKCESEVLRVHKLPHIHRAVRVTSDHKGRNFAVIQAHPKACLLEVPHVETTTMSQDLLHLLDEAATDVLHDVVFQVGGREFFAHKYIIASQNEYLSSLVAKESSSQSGRISRVTLDDIQPEIFEQILKFVYTSSCELLKPGRCTIQIAKDESKESTMISDAVSDDSEDQVHPYSSVDLSTVSAFEVYSAESKVKKTNKQRQGLKKCTVNKQNEHSDWQWQNPITLASQAAKKFSMGLLLTKLGKVRYAEGQITMKSDLENKSIPSFDREFREDLCDVIIRSEEGKYLKAHKCILSARLEYFNSMFNHGWIETSSNKEVVLPVPFAVLSAVLDYLYCDAAPPAEDVDLVCGVLVVADQLFATGLKEHCEVALAGALTLRNAVELLELCVIYNASQLKSCIQQYICLNLPAVLEARILEGVSNASLLELAQYYRALNPAVACRIIPPPVGAPCGVTIQSVSEAFPVCWDEGEQESELASENKKATKITKKKTRTRKTSASEGGKSSGRPRNESTSSNDECDISRDTPVDFNTITERSPSHKEEGVSLSLTAVAGKSEPWIKIPSSKHQKIVQARLRVISAAKDSSPLVEATPESFIKLTPKSSSPPRGPLVDLPNSVTKKDASTPSKETKQRPTTPPVPHMSIDFPELQRTPPVSPHDTSNCSKTPPKHSEIKKIPKLSQKQRKKLATEHSCTGLAEQLDRINQPNSAPAWGGAVSSGGCSWQASDGDAPSASYSLLDVMRHEIQLARQSSPVPTPSKQPGLSPVASSPQQTPPSANPWQKLAAGSSHQDRQVNFCDIIADERKQKENWVKMRAKSLELTQLEDKAMDELLVFYNAANADDERITVHRVSTGLVATPTWIISHH